MVFIYVRQIILVKKRNKRCTYKTKPQKKHRYAEDFFCFACIYSMLPRDSHLS